LLNKSASVLTKMQNDCQHIGGAKWLSAKQSQRLIAEKQRERAEV
jgi:hypothetical protein